MEPAPVYTELNNDQRREVVNTIQRFQAWREAERASYSYRGSMVWSETKGTDYLLRSYYDEAGRRRQKSLGRRSDETEQLKKHFEEERQRTKDRAAQLDTVLSRQAAVNRVLGLGRVPFTAARVVRALDLRGILGAGLRVVGTNAIYAYEAACSVHVDASLTATNDIDLLFDARRSLHLLAPDDTDRRRLLDLLRTADRSFEPSARTFRAVNGEGYMVDLIKPQPRDLRRSHRSSLSANDLEAAEIEGLVWLENAPAFEAVAIDEKGYPLRLIAPDPRAFAIHKHWVARQPGREPVKAMRDAAQALLVGMMTRALLPHLAFEPSELRMLPREIVASFLAELDARTPA